jgi:elongation factor 1 alpha-like protein
VIPTEPARACIDFTGSAVGQGLGNGVRNPWAVSAVDWGYFADAPWGAIPQERETMLVEERKLWPSGLLGGSSRGKSSKLAALAKRRKEQAQANAAAGERNTSVSLLSRLAQKPVAFSNDTSDSGAPVKTPPPPAEVDRLPTPPCELTEKQEIKLDFDQPIVDASVAFVPEDAAQAQLLLALPSRFAKSIFGERITTRQENDVADRRVFSLSENNLQPKASAFSGPSPDDVVVAARSESKGEGNNPDGHMAAKPIAGFSKKTPESIVQKTEEDLKSLSLESAPKKAEKIDVLKAYRESDAKENINFVVVGR